MTDKKVLKKAMEGFIMLLFVFNICIISVYAEEDNDSFQIERLERFEELRHKGIPEEKIYRPGDEIISDQFHVGFTITDFQYIDDINELDSSWFSDYDNIMRFVDDNGNLRDYCRLKCTRNSMTDELTIIEERIVGRRFLKVDVLARALQDAYTGDIPMYGKIIYTENNTEGKTTWYPYQITFQPEDGSLISYDEMCIGFSEAEYTENERDKKFFWKHLQPNETVEYSLIFAIDEDFITSSDYLIELGALYNDIYNDQGALSGYFYLSK